MMDPLRREIGVVELEFRSTTLHPLHSLYMKAINLSLIDGLKRVPVAVTSWVSVSFMPS